MSTNTIDFYQTFETSEQVLLCAMADLISESESVQAIPHPTTDMDALLESVRGVIWRRTHEFGQTGLINWIDDVLLSDYTAAEGLLVGAQITIDQMLEKL